MAKKNFTITTVATAPSPATSGTSLVVAAGTGSLFALNEPAIIFPVNDQPLVANAEIVMVTNVATDTLTITRTQESTSARTIVAGDIIIQGITAKDWNDLITSVAGKITAFADPNADRIVFWDDSEGTFAALTASTGLTISGTNMTVRSASETATGIVERATDTEFTNGTDTTRFVNAKQVASVSQTMTNKTLISPLFGGTIDGWISAGETWTYASADDPTFTFTVNADVTGKYSAGMKIKLTQGTVKYFIITAVSTFSGGNTTITVYGGTDYDLANSAISNNYYSMVRSPFGFPMSPVKWSVIATPSNYSKTSNVTSGAIYNAGSIDIPIGVWDFSSRCTPAAGYYQNGWRISARIDAGISTANNTFSVHSATSGWSAADITTSNYFAFVYWHYVFEQVVELATKATYYLNISMPDSLGDPTANRNLYCDNMRLVARCAYL